MENDWPIQSKADEYFGNPRGEHGGHVDAAWVRKNLVFISPPEGWPQLHMGAAKVDKIQIHRKVAPSLQRVMDAIAERYYQEHPDDPKQAMVTDHLDRYSGSFSFRLMRGGAHLSMHSYGCAIDFDAEANPFQSQRHFFRSISPIVEEFEKESWVWGGRWRSPDAMHFQAAKVA